MDVEAAGVRAPLTLPRQTFQVSLQVINCWEDNVAMQSQQPGPSLQGRLIISSGMQNGLLQLTAVSN